MGGRERRSWGHARLGWVGAGALGLALLTQSCGKTGRNGSSAHGDGGTSPTAGSAYLDEPASAGEGPGGAETVGGSVSIGGSADRPGETGAANEGGAGGAPPEPRRPITAHVIDAVKGGIAGVPVYIAGETFVSNADGVVHATAPFGAYDAVVLDVDVPDTYVEYWTGIHVYEQLTTGEPFFTLFRYYADLVVPKSYVSGALTGPYAADAEAQLAFSPQPGGLTSISTQLGGSSYSATGLWSLSNLHAAGDLLALLWSSDQTGRPAAFWYGQTPLVWGPELPAATANLAVTAVPTEQLTLNLHLPSGMTSSGTLIAGPFAWDVGGNNELNGTSYAIPKAPSPSALRPAFLLRYSADVEAHPASGSITTRVPPNVGKLQVEAPELPAMIAPTAGAKNVKASATFRFNAVPDTCHVIRLDIFGQDVTIHTVRHEFTPPDLSAWGLSWPSHRVGQWWVESTGPCSSTDDAVQASPTQPDRTSQFWLHAQKFTTAK